MLTMKLRFYKRLRADRSEFHNVRMKKVAKGTEGGSEDVVDDGRSPRPAE